MTAEYKKVLRDNAKTNMEKLASETVKASSYGISYGEYKLGMHIQNKKESDYAVYDEGIIRRSPPSEIKKSAAFIKKPICRKDGASEGE